MGIPVAGMIGVVIVVLGWLLLRNMALGRARVNQGAPHTHDSLQEGFAAEGNKGLSHAVHPTGKPSGKDDGVHSSEKYRTCP